MTENTRMPALEDRVVAALRAEGALSAPRRRLPAGRIAAVAVAILAATFWSAYSLGRASIETASRGDGKFLLLLYGADSASASEESARVAEYAAWAAGLSGEHRLEAAERLGAVMRSRGPAIASLDAAPPPLGFFVVRAASLDEADAIASTCPHVRHGGTVVVRQVE